MSFKNIEYTKLEIEKDDEFGNEPVSQPLNSNFKSMDSDEDKSDDLNNKNNAAFWNFRFYQNLFDIDTKDVLKRLIYSFLPNPRISYLKSVINNKPDLYGPFWTCTTLILTIAIAGNIANYFQFDGQKHVWRYEFRKLSLAAMSIYTYWWLMPLFIWGVAKWKVINETSFLELLTLYGYSLAIYIPISILWVIQVGWFQWLLVIVALVLSGFVLVLSIWSRYSDSNRQVALMLVGITVAMHSLLAVGFMLYFFHVPSNGQAPVPTPTRKPIVGKSMSM